MKTKTTGNLAIQPSMARSVLVYRDMHENESSTIPLGEATVWGDERGDMIVADLLSATEYVRTLKIAHNCTEEPLPPRSEWFEAYRCTNPNCEALDINTGYALYECKSCGERYTSAKSADGKRQCPECGDKGQKITAHACYECESAVADEVMAYECPTCKDWVQAPY